MHTPPPSVGRVNADTTGGGHAVAGAVLGGTAGDGWGRAAAYDAYADGLHTYALWYLRDHDAGAAAAPPGVRPRACRSRGGCGPNRTRPASRGCPPRSYSSRTVCAAPSSSR